MKFLGFVLLIILIFGSSEEEKITENHGKSKKPLDFILGTELPKPGALLVDQYVANETGAYFHLPRQFTTPFTISPEMIITDDSHKAKCVLMHLKVKLLEIKTIDDINWTCDKYTPKSYNYGGPKDFHEVYLSLCPDYLSINDVSLGFWDNSNSSLSFPFIHKSLIYDPIFKRIILEEPASSGYTIKDGKEIISTRYIFLHLFTEDEDCIRVTNWHEKLPMHNLTSFNFSEVEDQHAKYFSPKPDGLFFSKLGYAYEHAEYDLIFKKSFDLTKLTHKSPFFLKPLTCPNEENNFNLQLNFETKQEGILVATVICGSDNVPKWSFQISDSHFNVKKIYFHPEEQKVWFIDENVQHDFDFLSSPTLRLEKLLEGEVAKLHISQQKYKHQNGWSDCGEYLFPNCKVAVREAVKKSTHLY